MTAALVVALILAWTGAGVFVGLWLGERGRRIAAENLQLYGTPERRPAEKLAPPPEPEDVLGMDRGPQAVAHVSGGLLELARAEGKRLTQKEAEEEARRLLGMGDWPDQAQG